MLLLFVLLGAQLVSAACSTQTVSVTSTTTITDSFAVPSTYWQPVPCTTTTVAAVTEAVTATAPATETATSHPDTVVQRPDADAMLPSALRRRSATPTAVPEGLTNAERMQRGLPLRSPRWVRELRDNGAPVLQRKRQQLEPSCLPATATVTVWATSSVAEAVTSAFCLYTATTEEV